AARVPLAVTGGFRSLETMQSALDQGVIDVVGLARPLCVEPDFVKRALDGSSALAPSQERNLALGPGWFGPNSSSATMRGLNAQAQTAWYYAQLLRLAAGEEPNLALSIHSALWSHYGREYRVARARRAARAGRSTRALLPSQT
ncbi:MAG: hypothetical protein RL701_2151, partial [Pseudomonadota bacterium]